MRCGQRRRVLARVLVVVGAFVLTVGTSSGDSAAPQEPLLPFSTYLGGSGTDSPGVVAIGPDGVVWIVATTSSNDFPGAPRTGGSTPGTFDVVVLRVDPTTRTVLSTVRLGGAAASGIAFDTQGNAYVSGDSRSSHFPTTGEPLNGTASGRGPTSFVARVRPDGSGFVWVYAIGGSGWFQYASGICVTADGDPVLVGTTTSSDFPLVAPLKTTYGGDNSTTMDAFVVRLRADGTAPVFSTYLGGSGHDAAQAVCLSPDGGIVVEGQTSSADFVGDVAPIIGEPSGLPYYSSYLAEVEPSGTGLRRVVQVGVYVHAMTLTPDGLFLVGRAGADSGLPFPPRTPDARDDDFLLRLDATSWTPSGGRFLGPALKSESIDAVSVGADGTVWVAGAWRPDATNATRLAVPGAARPHPGSAVDAYIAAFKSVDFSQTFGTYLGGSDRDTATSVTVAPDGTAWTVGSTSSKDFPTSRPIQATLATTTPYGSNLFIAQTIAGDPPSRPAPVLESDASPVDAHAIRVSWSPGEGTASAFGIDRSEGDDLGSFDGWTRVALVDGDAREWVDAGLRADRAYRYSIQAVNTAGGSPPSEPVAATTPPTIDFSIQLGIANYRWSRRRARHQGDALMLRGNMRASGAVGRALDLPVDGLRLIGDDIDFGWRLFVIEPADPAWHMERDGNLTWRKRGDWFRFDPATGDFRLRFVSRHLSLVSFTDSGGFEPTPLRLVVGEGTGSVAPTWRAIRRPGRNRWYGRAGSRTP